MGNKYYIEGYPKESGLSKEPVLYPENELHYLILVGWWDNHKLNPASKVEKCFFVTEKGPFKGRFCTWNTKSLLASVPYKSNPSETGPFKGRLIEPRKIAFITKNKDEVEDLLYKANLMVLENAKKSILKSFNRLQNYLDEYKNGD